METAKIRHPILKLLKEKKGGWGISPRVLTLFLNLNKKLQSFAFHLVLSALINLTS